MRLKRTAFVVFLSVTALSRNAVSQTPPASKPATARVLDIDRWITKPRPITLTTDQKIRFDSLRARYMAEVDTVQHPTKKVTQMDVVMGIQRLDTRYQLLVEAILTADQKTVFESNIRAPTIGF